MQYKTEKRMWLFSNCCQGTDLDDLMKVLPAGPSLPDRLAEFNDETHRTALVWLDVALARDTTAAIQESWGTPSNWLVLKIHALQCFS
jgi:hypothetical protein